MDLTPVDKKMIMALWGEHNLLLTKIMKELQADYEKCLGTKGTQWENAKQSVDYLAKKQALVDLKKIFEKSLC